MRGDEWEHSTASFIVRLKVPPEGVLDGGSGNGADRAVLGRIEHVQTGRRVAIHRLDELVPFIIRCLKDHAPLTFPVLALALVAGGPMVA